MSFEYRRLVYFFLLYFMAFQIHAMDETSVIVIPRLEGSITFDGIPDEAAWENISPFQMVTHVPVFGLEPTEKTDVRVTYDHDYIYIGASFYAEDASLIRSATKQRDGMGAESDILGVLFDTYNDNENAVVFLTTPSGNRTDMTVFNDAVPRMPETLPVNDSWNTFWDVETRTTDKGWFVEMRIPVSSLRFQELEGEVTMGMTLFRNVPYLNEAYVFPVIPNEFGTQSMLKVSRAQKIVFRDLKSRKPLYIAPYVIGGFTQMNELNETETSYDYSREDKLTGGLDIKYGISSNLTLDVTLNTDFAQVESDDEKVNLTRFSLFYEEKRQFFLERASLFDFNTGGPTTMFYSRRIGLDEDFKPVPIIGGIRLIGRKGGWDAGFLNMQTAKSDSLPSENFSVLRLKRKIINANSYMGGILTSRVGMDGSYNEVYGLDGLIRITGDEYLKLSWAQSFESGSDNRLFSLDNTRYQIEWERRKNIGFYYMLSLSGAGEDLNPGIGYLGREDYHRYGMDFNYSWLLGEKSPIMRHGPGFRNSGFIKQGSGIYESSEYSLFYELHLKSNWYAVLSTNYSFDNVFELFELSDDAGVPPGEYWYPFLSGAIATPSTNPAWVIADIKGGSYYDGRYVSLTLMPSWSLSSSLVISGAYIFNKVDFSSRNQQFTGHIGRLKTLFMFSTKLSASAFVQYNSSIKTLSSNFRFRYNPREGNDLYLVYNEGTNTDLERDILKIPRMADRTVMLKYTYTFQF
jgi:hypothetical protein